MKTMDLYFDKKEIKKFKKLGMTDAEIEEMRIHKMIENVIDANCTRASARLGRNIVFSDNSGKFILYLKTSKGQYVELNCSAALMVSDFERALQELDFDLRTRLYYLS